jgi:hypothetical protein
VWGLTNVASGPNGTEYSISVADITYWVTDKVPSKITIKAGSGGTLRISGDKASGEDNWNGTWKKQ